MKKNIARAIIDSVLVALFLAIVIGKDLSVLAHEILSLAFCLGFLLHLSINRRTLFAKGAKKAVSEKPSPTFSRSLVFFINLLTGAALLINIVSGLLISELIPALNLGMRIFYEIHSYSFLAILALLAMHLCMHIGWLNQAWQKIVRQKAPLIQLVFLCTLILSASVFYVCERKASALVENEAEETALSESATPILTPGLQPTFKPSAEETAEPAAELPVIVPDAQASLEPIAEPTFAPTAKPTTEPTIPPDSGAQALSFTLAELSRYNGQNGNPAYMAVDGVVYDVSSCFKGGRHKGYNAGEDLSAAFHDEHSAKELEGLPVVGTLQP